VNKGGKLKLLVSVADAAEARTALSGGADIIDAKDPSRGALGRVSPGALLQIRAAVPPDVPLSAALGEARDSDQVPGLFEGVDVPLSFVKLGLRGRDPETARGIVAAAAACASRLPGRPGLVVVAFADLQDADALSMREVAGLAIGAPARGLLVDTAHKDSGSLFDFAAFEELRDLRALLAMAQLSFAIAGCLTERHLPLAIRTGADIVGVRGAACDGGRTARVSAQAVARLVQALDREIPVVAPATREPVSA
jgi:(5-formylfuran-3-yl)methyl phosphate synthase